MDFLIILLGLTMLIISSSSRVETYIRLLSVQGLLLFLMSIFGSPGLGVFDVIVVVAETLVVKTVLIPLFLTRIVRRNEIYKEVESRVSNFFSLVISTAIFGLGFLLAYYSNELAKDIRPLQFGLSISTMFTALFLIVNRQKIITHILGYMLFENGIFMLSLSLSGEMPLIVDMGVLLDLFIGVFLLGLFVNEFQGKED